MNTQDFNLWLKRMTFTGYGGQKKAAEALGVSTAMIRNYAAGTVSAGRQVEYSRMLDLACAALANSLRPWSEMDR